MAAFICRVCGGILELTDRRTCRCGSCGVIQSVPLLDRTEKAELCARAEELRRQFRYDKAVQLYEELIRLDPTDADLYWALALCRYGIEYSQDGSEISLNRTQAHSFLSDDDYKQALKFAAPDQREIMERQAAQIDGIRRATVELSRTAEYDVYLCCRETDAKGLCTEEIKISSGIYEKLTAEGLRVFFPHVTLEDDSGIAAQQVETIASSAAVKSEPYIFGALSSAKVMIVVGTSVDSFNEVWVRNTWSRFLSQDLTGRVLIPAVRGMNANELPEELSRFQALDMSRLGFESDLVASIRGIFGERKTAEIPAARSPLVRRAYMFLEDGDISGAEKICEKLTEQGSDTAECFVIRLLIEYRLRSEEELDTLEQDFTLSENYRGAMRVGGENVRERLREHSFRALYNKYTGIMQNTSDERECRAAAAGLRSLGDYENSAELAQKAEERAQELKILAEQKRREGIYALSVKALEESDDPAVLRSAQQSLASLGDYRDSAALSERCGEKLAGLPTAAYPPEKNSGRNKLPFIIAGVVVTAAAAVILIATFAGRSAEPAQEISVISQTSDTPEDRYAHGKELLASGDYDEAELVFTALGDYSDSADKVKECKYRMAEQLLEEGETDQASRAFVRLGDYSDSPERVKECAYVQAGLLEKNGDLEEAAEAFAKLGSYSNAESRERKCRYNLAVKLYESGETAKAKEIFTKLGGYYDSEIYVNRIDYERGKELLDSGDYNAAYSVLDSVHYSDSRDLAKESLYLSAKQSLDNGEWSDALSAIHKLGDYKDCDTLEKEVKYRQAQWLIENGGSTTAYELLSSIGDYKDTTELCRQLRENILKEGSGNSAVFLGSYTELFTDSGTAPIKWRVLKTDGNKVLIIADKAIDYLPFDETDSGASWKNSTLREWLNGEFYESAFTDEEKSIICISEFDAFSEGVDYVGECGGNIADKVFLLNDKETEKMAPRLYGAARGDGTYYTQRKTADTSRMFYWGRDGVLADFVDASGNDSKIEMDRTWRQMIKPAMWIKIS